MVYSRTRTAAIQWLLYLLYTIIHPKCMDLILYFFYLASRVISVIFSGDVRMDLIGSATLLLLWDYEHKGEAISEIRVVVGRIYMVDIGNLFRLL